MIKLGRNPRTTRWTSEYHRLKQTGKAGMKEGKEGKEEKRSKQAKQAKHTKKEETA